MSTSLSLISLNCESDKHFDFILPFLKEQQRQSNADVICLQEIFQDDVAFLEKELGIQITFLPYARIERENQYNIPLRGLWGIGVGSALPLKNIRHEYYKGDAHSIPEFLDGQPNSINRGFIAADIEKDSESFTVVTTHFTWSANGEIDDDQRRDFPSFIQKLDQIGEFVLCGDLNAVRGRELFAKFTEKYHDNLPAEVRTTLDPQLHRAKKDLVVDALLTTPIYRMENVRVQCGLSDHCAVMGMIQHCLK